MRHTTSSTGNPDNRDPSASPSALEQTLLESIILDEEGAEAEGVAMATARLQKEFSDYYSEQEEQRDKAKKIESVVPLPLER